MQTVNEKKAQIKILYHLLDRLCNGELPEAGRKAVKSLIANLNKEIDDISKSENITRKYHGDFNK